MSRLYPMALLRRLLGIGRIRSEGASESASPAREPIRDPFRAAFEPYRTRRIEIHTLGGTIEGIVVEPAEPCLIVRETSDTLVFLPYANVLSFKPKT